LKEYYFCFCLYFHRCRNHRPLFCLPWVLCFLLSDFICYGRLRYQDNRKPNERQKRNRAIRKCKRIKDNKRYIKMRFLERTVVVPPKTRVIKLKPRSAKRGVCIELVTIEQNSVTRGWVPLMCEKTAVAVECFPGDESFSVSKHGHKSSKSMTPRPMNEKGLFIQRHLKCEANKRVCSWRFTPTPESSTPNSPTTPISENRILGRGEIVCVLKANSTKGWCVYFTCVKTSAYSKRHFLLQGSSSRFQCCQIARS